MEVFKIALESLFYMLPAITANITPIILARYKLFESLNTPLDFGKTWKGKPIFGKSKTWRGLLCGVIVAMATGVLQEKIWPGGPFGLPEIKIYTLAFLLGMGVLLFDLLKSFLKRRFGISPGSKWIPFDQMDFYGSLLLSALLFTPPFPHLITLIIAIPFTHALANIIGFALRWKKVPW